MLAFVQFEHGFIGFEVVPLEDSGLLELREHAVDRGKPYLHSFSCQEAVNLLGRQVTHFAGLEQAQDVQSRCGDFQAMGFQIGNVTHGTGFQERASTQSSQNQVRADSDAAIAAGRVDGFRYHIGNSMNQGCGGRAQRRNFIYAKTPWPCCMHAVR